MLSSSLPSPTSAPLCWDSPCSISILAALYLGFEALSCLLLFSRYSSYAFCALFCCYPFLPPMYYKYMLITSLLDNGGRRERPSRPGRAHEPRWPGRKRRRSARPSKTTVVDPVAERAGELAGVPEPRAEIEAAFSQSRTKGLGSSWCAATASTAASPRRCRRSHKRSARPPRARRRLQRKAHDLLRRKSSHLAGLLQDSS